MKSSCNGGICIFAMCCSFLSKFFFFFLEAKMYSLCSSRYPEKASAFSIAYMQKSIYGNDL